MVARVADDPPKLTSNLSWQNAPAKDTPFLRHKAFFYTARIFRELLPNIGIAICLYDFFTSMLMVMLGDAYDTAIVLPGKSVMLDKIMAKMILQHPPKFGIITLDVYDSAWQPRATWKSSATDDWWCAALSATNAHHVPYLGGGACGVPTTPFNCSDLSNIHIESLGVDFRGFPDADSGWQCLVAPNLPAAAPKLSDVSECYSFCLDISASAPRMPCQAPMDMWYIFLFPLLIDLWTILLPWTHAHMLLLGVEKGNVPRRLQLKYGATALVFWLLVVALLASSSSLVGWWSPLWWPGPSPVTLIILLSFASYFTCLAVEQFVPPIRCYMRLVYKVFMCLVGVKTLEDAKPKWPIDSDAAFCFYLVRVYKTKAALVKKVCISLVVYIFLFWVSLWLAPAIITGFDGFDFLMSKFVTLVLLGISFFSALKPPDFMVDYRAHQKKKDYYPSITLASELGSVFGTSALSLVSKEALRYLYLEVLDENSPVQVTDDRSGSVTVNAGVIAGAVGTASLMAAAMTGS